jgi:hypothetical protein
VARGGRGDGQAAASGRRRADGGVRESEMRERRRKENPQAVYFSSLPSARDLALGKDFFKILKYSLSSARSLTLGKVSWAALGKYTFTILCRVSTSWHSAKAAFAECHFLTLGKVYFYFFNFPNQNFCGMFLHYIDLHVPF